MGFRFNAAILGMVWLISPPAWATTVLEKSFTDLVQEADTIVVGTVAAIESAWDPSHEMPLTLITVTDLEVLKGEAEDTELTVQVLGGARPDGTVFQIAGVPRFAVGERTILFVAGNGTYAVPFVGLWQGIYRVVVDPERDTETVYTHDMQPLIALPTGTGDILHDAGPDGHHMQAQQSATPMALEDFTQSIVEEMEHD